MTENGASAARPEAATTPADVPPTDAAAYRLAFFLLRLVFDGYIHTRVTGLDRFPPSGTPVVVAANHVSSLDVFAAGHALHRPGYFLAKVEATQNPLFGRFLRAIGAIPAHRDGNDSTAVKLMLAALKAGHVVGVAPEGTRSPDGRMGAYDPGFVWLAERTGALIVPCAIHGVVQLMPKGARYPRRGTIWVRFGAPIMVAAPGARLSRGEREAMAEQVRHATLDMLADLVRETGVSHPAVTAEREGVRSALAGEGKA